MAVVAADANYCEDVAWGKLASGEATDAEGCVDKVAAVVAALDRNQADTVLLQGGQFGSVTDDDCQVLADALVTNTSVTHLDLSMNRIGDAGARALAAALERGDALMDVRLDGNFITAEGVEALCRAVEQSVSLTKLDLSSNEFGHEGAAALAAMFRRCEHPPPLLALHARGAGIDDLAARDLIDAVQSHSQLTALHLSGNQLSDAAVPPLCNLIAHSPSLLDLNVANNAFSDDGVRQLVDTICATRTLLHAQLSKGSKRYEPPALRQTLTENRRKAAALQDEYQAAALAPNGAADTEALLVRQEQHHQAEKQALADEIALLRDQLRAEGAPAQVTPEPQD
eukprot:TRINITY_DN6948_c0_g1_i1.p1 TRINITY_DN6948_c0_g1~~TRINITY_DN6948_c0_g1_i1.p1  ORF type:complete len:341 (+),score=129.47 TRINITY_DN6948_c0_g1_i1:73-1095(+)